MAEGGTTWDGFPPGAVALDLGLPIASAALAQGGPLWITGYDAARFVRSIAFGLAKRGY